MNKRRQFFLALLAICLLVYKIFNGYVVKNPTPQLRPLPVVQNQSPAEYKPKPDPTCLPGQIGAYNAKHGVRHFKKGRTKKIKFTQISVDANGRVTLPKDFEKLCDVIVLPHRQTKKQNFTVYNISWSAELEDGTYYLLIYPNFIYLRTGHDNPNPDDFYWHSYLQPKQHEAIVAFLKENKRNQKIFSNDQYRQYCLIPRIRYKYDPLSNPTGKEIAKEYSKYKNFVYENFRFCIWSFNQAIGTKAEPIPIPTEKGLFQHEIRMVYGLYELD